MKKVIALILSILFCFFCSSCDKLLGAEYDPPEIPSTSENFDQSFVDSFFQDYRVLDSNLYYLSANPWEVQIKLADMYPDSYYGKDCFYLATIPDADKNQFVSVTRYKHNLLFDRGRPDYSSDLYQHINAPVPMRDWTISSVSLISTWHSPMSPLEEVFSKMQEVNVYAGDIAEDFFQSLKTSYEEKSDVSRGTVFTQVGSDGTGKHYGYYLMVRFKECENIIWCSSLSSDKDGLYFNCQSTEITEGKDGKRNYETKLDSARIDDQYAAEIMRLIEEHMKTL